MAFELSTMLVLEIEKKREDYAFRCQFNENPVLYRAAKGLLVLWS